MSAIVNPVEALVVALLLSPFIFNGAGMMRLWLLTALGRKL